MATIKRERASIESDNKKRYEGIKLTDLLIPILSILVFILLLIFVFIPLINEGMVMRDEIDQVKSKQEQMIELNDTLTKTNRTRLQANLEDARTVIPETLKVSEFAFYIDSLATSKGLVFKEISSSNIDIEEDPQESETFSSGGNTYSGVSGPLSYSGTYSQIVSFLEDLQISSPYIISLSAIRVNNDQATEINSTNWTLEISATGYFLESTSTANVNIYATFTPYTEYDRQLRVFEQKSARLSPN